MDSGVHDAPDVFRLTIDIIGIIAQLQQHGRKRKRIPDNVDKRPGIRSSVSEDACNVLPISYL